MIPFFKHTRLLLLLFRFNLWQEIYLSVNSGHFQARSRALDYRGLVPIPTSGNLVYFVSQPPTSGIILSSNTRGKRVACSELGRWRRWASEVICPPLCVLCLHFICAGVPHITVAQYRSIELASGTYIARYSRICWSGSWYYDLQCALSSGPVEAYP